MHRLKREELPREFAHSEGSALARLTRPKRCDHILACEKGIRFENVGGRGRRGVDELFAHTMVRAWWSRFGQRVAGRSACWAVLRITHGWHQVGAMLV